MIADEDIVYVVLFRKIYLDNLLPKQPWIESDLVFAVYAPARMKREGFVTVCGKVMPSPFIDYLVNACSEVLPGWTVQGFTCSPPLERAV